MGLFDKIKNVNESYKQNYTERKRIEKEKKERQERIKIAREKNEKKIMEKLQIEKEKKENEKKRKIDEKHNILEEKTKICLKCNKKYGDSNNFCFECGQELTNISDMKKTINEVINKIIESIKEDVEENFLKQSISFSGFTVIEPVSYEKIETQHIKDKHGAGTKVLATAIAGPLGFVATTGIKQETLTEEKRIDGEYLHFNLDISDKHITYTSYVDNIKSTKFTFGRGDARKIIIKWKDVDYLDDDYNLILKNNDVYKFPILTDKVMVKTQIKKIAEQESINIKIIEKYFLSIEAKIDKYYIELVNNKAKNSNNDLDITKSDLDELERIVNLYEKGLLTDDEFAAMKKKLIEED